jgi:hypothetical protein
MITGTGMIILITITITIIPETTPTTIITMARRRAASSN